ncbi:hypothetical protein [Lactobacillus psittaci]|uniref:Uncharacterized protein n=1 Tax=Lactobacillus psittaci DSM 15354 TaxID=1122152 RepID=A0A0R1SA83_9LACO|nr:hypothetical protein [Lactobacillus psittaci]KRL63642.1 hypothetical protein FC23_GL000551 [Lactobacillus psittaci DSM 15354]
MNLFNELAKRRLKLANILLAIQFIVSIAYFLFGNFSEAGTTLFNFNLDMSWGIIYPERQLHLVRAFDNSMMTFDLIFFIFLCISVVKVLQSTTWNLIPMAKWKILSNNISSAFIGCAYFFAIQWIFITLAFGASMINHPHIVARDLNNLLDSQFAFTFGMLLLFLTFITLTIIFTLISVVCLQFLISSNLRNGFQKNIVFIIGLVLFVITLYIYDQLARGLILNLNFFISYLIVFLISMAIAYYLFINYYECKKD